MSLTSIGDAPFSREQMLDSLEEFSALYAERPIKDNAGGMKSPHLFLAWFALRALKPLAVIESGVWLGQGTWFFERACPDAELFCIDLDLSRILYRSKRARYLDRDFSALDWTDLPARETVLFFDDHQNAVERVKTAMWFGFSHILFEDNYPVSQGDCYSLKKAFAHAGFTPLPKPQTLKSRIRESIVGRQETQGAVEPNEVDAKYLRKNLEVYAELPPVFMLARTRWGDEWDGERYPTPPPLLQSVEREYQRIFFEEASQYTWMAYAKLS
jgi:hypothetical protein